MKRLLILLVLPMLMLAGCASNEETAEDAMMEEGEAMMEESSEAAMEEGEAMEENGDAMMEEEQ